MCKERRKLHVSNLHMLHSARLPGQTTDDVHAERQYYRGLNHKDLVIQLTRRGIVFIYSQSANVVYRNYTYVVEKFRFYDPELNMCSRCMVFIKHRLPPPSPPRYLTIPSLSDYIMIALVHCIRSMAVLFRSLYTRITSSCPFYVASVFAHMLLYIWTGCCMA